MVITQTPLRISLLGGNTDFPKYFNKYGGACLTATLNKYIYCIIKERFDKEIWINYSIKEKVEKVDHIKHDLVREAMRLTGVENGVEITFLSDIPSEGSGLGSSSAVTVGVLNALHNYMGESVTARQLAEEACYIEVNILKKPIGYQDQYAVAFGGINVIEFTKNYIELIPFESLAQFNLMLFYTGITRKADSVLSNMKLNKRILDRNKELVYEGADHFSDDYEEFGKNLDEYWQLKKKLNKKVTNLKIDKLYDKAIKAGAIGGKIVGAGAGGFLLFVVSDNKRDSVSEALSLQELPFMLSKYGSRVIFNI